MKITDEVYALDATRGSYAYVILGEENILVDSSMPGRGQAILDELKTLGISPENIKQIMITHHDVDHIGNAAFLQKTCKAELWASQEDIPYILGDKTRHGIKKYLKSFFKVEIPKNIKLFPPEFRMGEIEIIPTPGHTPGHVCLLYREVLFAGDLVRSQKGQLKPSPGIMNWAGSKVKESIKQIAHYPFKWVCPAHGDPIQRGDLWEKMYSSF